MPYEEENNNKIIMPLISALLLSLVIFTIDLQLPLGVAGGVPYVAVVLVSLWFRNYKYVIALAVLCSILTLMGFYFSPEGGELWKVMTNRALALFAIWVTALLAIKWKKTIETNVRINFEVEKKREKEKIFLATLKSSLHITNNLLNQLQFIELEINKNPDFNKKTFALFIKMQTEASSLLEDLSSVKEIEADEIMHSVNIS